jgi:hypothetical protein
LFIFPFGLSTARISGMQCGMKYRISVLLLCVLIICIVPSSGEKGLEPLRDHPIDIDARPVFLNESDVAMNKLGRLTFLGGWSLSSPDPAFGGLSALLVSHGQFQAIGDTGTRLSFRFDDRTVSNARIKALPAGCGKRWLKRNQDSESMAINQITGIAVLGLEMRQSLCIFAPESQDRALEVAPPQMMAWPRTGGAESVAFLSDGRLLVLAERDDDANNPVTPALLFPAATRMGVGHALAMGYRAPVGFRPVDAVALKDGRLLILNRRFEFPFRFEASLIVIEKPAFGQGAILEGVEIARFQPPFITDNLEGLTVDEKSEGTIIWLTSDNNFMPIQRTLLLKFQLGK